MALLSNIKAILSLDTKDFKRGLKESEKQTQSFGKVIGKAGAAIGAAFSVAAVVRFGKEMSELSHKATNVGKAFQNTGVDLERLVEATGGGVSNLDLMQKSIRAINLGIRSSDLPQFFEFAAVRAAETGESVDYLVNSIVDGIGRRSTLVLDNLGISATELQEEIKKVGDFGLAAANIINRSMSENTLTVDEAASGFTKLSTAWDNFSVSVATGGVGAIFGNILTVAASILEKIQTALGLGQAFEVLTTLDTSVLTLKQMREELNRLETQVKMTSSAVDAGVLFAYDDTDPSSPTYKINQLRKAISEYGKVTLTAEQQTAAFNNILAASGPLVESFFKPITFGQKGYDGGITPMASLSADIDLTAESFDNATKSIEKYRQSLADTVQPALDLGQAISASLGQAITIMADSIGQLIAGDTEGALNSFISGIAGLMKQFGSLLIAWGAAQIAIKASAANPYVAIAAGAALVAIGALMSSKQSQITGSGYYGGSGYGSYGGGSYGSGGGYTSQREIVLVARGNDLVGVLNAQNYEDNLIKP